MVENPTLDTADYSRTIIQETVRTGIEDHLDAEFDDPADRSGKTPPLVVTALPEGARVTYPHVVIGEQSDDVSALDNAQDLSQHDFAVDVEIHGRTTTEMFNLRGLVRSWFLDNRATLRDAGWAELSLSGNSADWDPTAKTSTWRVTASGLLHTHPDT